MADARSPRAQEPASPSDSAEIPHAAPDSFARKLDHLFKTVRPAKGEYSHDHVARTITSDTGVSITGAYIGQLRKGSRDNPGFKHIDVLAGFFGVPPGYFFDDEVSARVDEQLALVASLRDGDVRKVALRASGLSSDSLAAISTMIETVRRLEGLPEDSESEEARG